MPNSHHDVSMKHFLPSLLLSFKQHTWCNINGSRKDGDKGVEGVLVEGVDLVQAVQQEEQHSPSCCHSTVLHK